MGLNNPVYIDCTVDMCSGCVDKDSCNRTSCNNSVIVNLSNIESSIEEHLELSLYKRTSDNRTLKKTVMVFPGYEYEITYRDDGSGQCHKVKGLVYSISGYGTNLSSQIITMKYKNKPPKPESGCDKEITQGLPNCGCVLKKPNDNKYFDETTTVDIYVAYITDINYIGSGVRPEPPVPPRKMVKVVLLGISADIIRAVVINLKMLEDDKKEAVRDVCMKTGGIYTVTYFNAKDRAIYEFNGKLISIKETDQVPDPANCIVRKTEHVGMADSIYEECEMCFTEVDSYLNSCCIKKDVLLTFDTSIDFSGEYESIMLSWIRDCKVIDEEPEVTPPADPDDPESGDNKCDCCCGKEIKMNVGGNQLVIDPASQSVELTTDTSKEKYSLQEIMDFYFVS